MRASLLKSLVQTCDDAIEVFVQNGAGEPRAVTGAVLVSVLAADTSTQSSRLVLRTQGTQGNKEPRPETEAEKLSRQKAEAERRVKEPQTK